MKVIGLTITILDRAANRSCVAIHSWTMWDATLSPRSFQISHNHPVIISIIQINSARVAPFMSGPPLYLFFYVFLVILCLPQSRQLK